MKFNNPKNVFWEALLLTGVVFVLGLFLGMAFEANKLDEINSYYAQSEIFMMDFLALNNFESFEGASCNTLISSHLNFANRIYEEAVLLEKYEDAGKISENFKLAHWKYDLLRTFLWVNAGKVKDRCPNFDYIVYLYEYDEDDLVKRANNKVWSNILYEVKQEKGDSLILIPIAVNSGLSSLDVLLDKYEISTYPAIFINDEVIVTELGSSDDVLNYLN